MSRKKLLEQARSRTTGVRLTDAARKAIDKIARQNDRSVSYTIEQIVLADLARRNIMVTDNPTDSTSCP